MTRRQTPTPTSAPAEPAPAPPAEHPPAVPASPAAPDNGAPVTTAKSPPMRRFLPRPQRPALDLRLGQAGGVGHHALLLLDPALLLRE